MSSAASLTGGKYTRDLKLRVLEHYFRNGGDVFGNKQSTAKKFGVDSKTINRFLKIPELVRAARKNAKSNKSPAGSSGSFKEPLVPGPSGAGRSRPPQRQSVRITLPTQPDESIVNQTADGSTSSIGKLLKIFELGTQEIRDLLAAECDLIYECRVCRALFRSVANLLAHKRRYCTRGAAETRQVFGSGPGQSLAAPSDGVMVLPLPTTIDRLPEVRQAAVEEARAAVAQSVPSVRLEALPGSGVAVVQTVGEAEQSVGERLEEVHKMEEAARRTVKLGRDGRVVESDEEEEEDAEEAEQAEGEDGRHVCQHCNTTFSTRKTLSHHVRSLHSSTRIYYPCCLCSAAFINMFSVERHLQKVHKKKQDEVDVLKEGIKQKSFHRSVTEPQAASPGANPNMPMKVTSFEWKCRQCSRRYLSLPVGLQHVQSVHPQFSSARAGLVRVCRIIRQPADSGAVSTRSSSGAVTPADLERPGLPRDDDPEIEGEHSGDSEGRMLFNKANLLKRLASGGERCVLCRKVFTGHLQACGHLRLHDQRQIEAYLGQKVRLIRKRRPADVQAEPEEYELDGAAGASPPDEELEMQPESDADAESVMESPDDAIEEPAEDMASEPPTSVEARGFPVQMVAAERVRRRHFVHALPGGEHVCTLCDAKFPRWPAARAHLARHSRSEVARYVALHAVDGLVGVPAAIAIRPEREVDTVKPEEVEEVEQAEGEMEAEGEEEAEGAEEEDEENGEEEEEMDAEVEGEAASVDTDIAAGAKLLVSCKLWSPEKRRRAAAAEERQRDESENDEEEEEEEDEEDDTEQDNAPLTQELDGEKVDKWEAIRRKGSRLRCVVCNKTFMKSGYAEVHLRTEHTFREIKDFVSSWRLKGVRVPPRSGEADGDEEAEESDAEEPETAAPQPRQQPKPRPAVETKVKTDARPVQQKGAKRTAETAPAASPSKVVKREPTVMNVPSVKTTRDLARGAVGPIGPNTKILKISRSDLLQKCKDGLRNCLVCDRQFDSHPAACEHMRQHSDEDIRNFIKTRGREFLPAFEQRQKQKTLVRRASDGTGSTGSAPATSAAAVAKPVRSLSVGATDKSSDRPAVGAASATESPKPTTPTPTPTSPVTERRPPEPKPTPDDKPDPQLFHRDEAVCEFELFDKAQLLKRQPDGTKCLLCTRVFAKHSSACGHLSHHGAAEVQAWRTRMRRKASALLKLARRPRAYSGAEAEKPTKTTAEPDAKTESAIETDEKVVDKEAMKGKSETEAENEQPEAKKAKGDDCAAKGVKASDSTPVRVTRRKDSMPVKVTRADNAATQKDSKKDEEPALAQPVKASSPVKVVKADKSQSATRTFQVTGTSGTGRLVKISETLSARQAKATVTPDQADDADRKDAAKPAKTAISPPSAPKNAESSAKFATDRRVSDKIPDKTSDKSPDKTSDKAADKTPDNTPDNTPAKTPTQPATPVSAAKPGLPAAATVVRTAVSSAGVAVAPGGGAAPVRSAQLVKLPQAVKLALFQSADGTIQTAGGRTIMRLAPGLKLPITAASLPRVLRPIAPKAAAVVAAAGAAAAGSAGDGAGAAPVLQPPLAGAVTGPVSPPRPRPPPLLRAPLLQTMTRAGGGSITVHVPALKTTTSLPVGTVVTAVVPPGARAAAKGDAKAGTNAKTDGKTDTKADADGMNKGDEGKADNKADDKVDDKAEAKGKRPSEAVPPKKTAAVVEAAAVPDVKSEPELVSADDAKSSRRQGETKSGQAKSPAAPPVTETEKRAEPAVRSSQRKAATATAAVENPSDRPAAAAAAGPRSGVVTKRAFIPEVPAKPATVSAKPATRCSWTPESNTKSSPRASSSSTAAAAAATESSGKGSPTATPPGEVPQTRARAEAAVAARMRQTRRSSGATSATERK